MVALFSPQTAIPGSSQQGEKNLCDKSTAARLLLFILKHFVSDRRLQVTPAVQRDTAIETNKLIDLKSHPPPLYSI